MTTNWISPSKLEQYSEDTAELAHVEWKNLEMFPIETAKDLAHIARSPKPDLKNKTYFLKATHFNFQNLPTTITGIELKLTMRRKGRITDETVQLFNGNNLIGENKANLNLDPIKIYGGETDKWNLESISTSVLTNLNFGIVMRFQSHPKWPHKDSAIIDSVELRIH